MFRDSVNILRVESLSALRSAPPMASSTVALSKVLPSAWSISPCGRGVWLQSFLCSEGAELSPLRFCRHFFFCMLRLCSRSSFPRPGFSFHCRVCRILRSSLRVGDCVHHARNGVIWRHLFRYGRIRVGVPSIFRLMSSAIALLRGVCMRLSRKLYFRCVVISLREIIGTALRSSCT